MIFLGTVCQDVPSLLVIEFLNRVATIFEEYFGGPLDDEIVKENFSTVVRMNGKDEPRKQMACMCVQWEG